MTASFIPELEASGVAVEQLYSQAHASAFGFFVDAVAEGTLHHCADDELVQALTAANTRPLGDGGKAWSRRGSSVRIDGLVAITLALWGAQLRPPIPRVISMAEAVQALRQKRIQAGEDPGLLVNPFVPLYGRPPPPLSGGGFG